MASGGGAGTIFSTLQQSSLESGGGAEVQLSFAESIANIKNAKEFIDTFGEYTVDPRHVIPCCSLYYREESLEMAKRKTELLKLENKDNTNPTLNECLTKILDDEYVGPFSILRNPVAKILCLTAVFGNRWKDILEIKARTDLWELFDGVELPTEWVLYINSHGTRIDKMTPGNFSYEHTASFVSTACPGTSAFYHEENSIIDPEIILNDELRDEEFIKRSKIYLDGIGKDIETRLKKYDSLQLEKLEAVEKYKKNPNAANLLEFGKISSEIDKQKDNLKSLVKIFMQNKSHESYLKLIQYFERFLTGDEGGGISGNNTTIVSLIPKESADGKLTKFLEKYFEVKLSEAADDETQYYREKLELLRKTPINDWIRLVQADKTVNPTYAFAFNGSNKLNKLQTPMLELSIAIAHKKNSIGSCMCLSTFIFSNMESKENKFIDKLLSEDEHYKIRFGFVTSLLDNLSSRQVIFDNSCKGGNSDVDEEYRAKFPKLDLNNSQDPDTQPIIETARKCGGVCHAFQTGICPRGSNCRFSHKRGGKSKTKRRRPHKKSTRKKRR